MNKVFILLLFGSITLGCTNFSRYPISDNKEQLNSKLLGIWKAKEDTDSKNFFLVQNVEDVNIRNDYINKYKKQKIVDSNYWVTYFSRHGESPLYRQWPAFITKINNDFFLNVSCRLNTKEGYSFLRIINIDKASDTITIAVISDSTLQFSSSSKTVRDKITKNLHNPQYYADTIHFYKVSDFHSDIKGAPEKAGSY